MTSAQLDPSGDGGAKSRPTAEWRPGVLPGLSVVIPTLNSARTLAATLSSVGEAADHFNACEIIVADGGSSDGTAAIATALGAIAVSAERGRGPQIVAGCAAATLPWLLVLHADTRLELGWAEAVADHMHSTPWAAGWFRFRLDDPAPIARLWQRGVALRCAVLALPYGDQGLLISRAHYGKVGGFRALALMEDVDLARRIGRRRLRPLRASAITSADRFRKRGYLPQSIHNWSLLLRHALGQSPAELERLYD